ncbi:MAG TPA: hypothetical protein VHM70_09825 [Polyangiaceae bacterium]|jgi:hypothetical protein|nr:hypothetical protein [Polyangiaceae bacterium]
MPNPIQEARLRLQLNLGLSRDAAERAVSETLDCFRFEVDEFIRDRHGELQGTGTSNTDIYQRIADELPALRFMAPPLTARQIRRRIYG